MHLQGRDQEGLGRVNVWDSCGQGGDVSGQGFEST
jgi:hypothetical protein